MRIDGIRYNPAGGLNIEAEVFNDETASYERKSLKGCKQAPLAALTKAIQDLLPLGISTIEMGGLSKDKTLKVEGVRFKHSKKSDSISLDIRRGLKYGDSHVIKTPARIYLEDGSTDFFTEDNVALIEDVQCLAEKYWEGSRTKSDSKLWEKTEETRTAYAQGRTDFAKGKSILDNPFGKEKDGEDAVESWNLGYMSLKKENTNVRKKKA